MIIINGGLEQGQEQQQEEGLTVTLQRNEWIKLCQPPYTPSNAYILHKIREQVKLEMW